MESRKKNVSYLWKTLLKKLRDNKKESNYKYSDVSTAASFIMRLATRKKKSTQNMKQLLRAKTMPVIDVTSVLSTEELLQHGMHIKPPTTISLSGSSSSSLMSSSPKGKAVIMRKMSYSESHFNKIIEKVSSASTPSEASPLKKTKKFMRQRSQSEIRFWTQRRKPDVAKEGYEDSRRPSGSSFVKKVNDTGNTVPTFFLAPPQTITLRSSTDDGRLDASSSVGNLQKFQRLLALREKDSLTQTRTRSTSLDWGDAHTQQLLSSSPNESAMDILTGLAPSPNVPADLRETEQSYSPTMRDLQFSASSLRKKSSNVDFVDGQVLGKRKSDKEKRGMFDSQALFDAVEQQDLDLARCILDNWSSDINSLNMESLTVLDIAVMTNNIPMAKMLLSKGAKESPVFHKGECRLQRLESLVTEAEKKVIDLTAVVLNGSSGNSNISPVQLRDTEKQLGHWEFRHRLLKRMKAGYNYAKPPEPPSNVRLEVISSSSLRVSFAEPQSHNGAVVTKYKVQWSTTDSFVVLSGQAVVEDLSRLEYEITNLSKGNSYHVKVCAWNVKGYGLYSCSDPPSAAASSWQEVNNMPSRLEGKIASLYTLYCQVKKSRPPDTAEMKDVLNKETDSPMQKKRISIKSFFNSAPKFQKCVKRGVYMACLLYCKDKILVTSDEQLPIIEVDEMFSGPTVQTDLFWLLRISCMWEEVKILKQDMEKTSSARSTFRCKLLQAIVSLQTGLGIQDLGQFFHHPIRDTNSSIILTVVNHIRDPRLVTLGSSKWVTFGKLVRRQSLLTHDLADANSLLVNAVPDMVLYHQVSRVGLPRGLYLGYVKLQASIEVLKVMVMNKAPNCVPHVKIRDCPNVTREEWEWLLKSDRFIENMSNAQKSFQQLLTEATRKLFAQLDLPNDSITNHRIYDLEVLELSPSVSMILVLPSTEDVCIVPGYPDSMAKKADCSFLPVQIFESIHMHAYMPEFFSMYARLSTVVEMDGMLAQQGHREAFSTEELSKTKEQVEVTTQLQKNLDKIWKCARWIRDITSYARNREKKAGIGLSHVFLSTAVSSSNYTSATGNKQNALRLNIEHHSNNYLSTSPTQCEESRRLSYASDAGDQRCIAKFYDPNEETPHSSDIINIGRASVRSMDKEAKFYLSDSASSTPSHFSTQQTRFSTTSLSSVSSSSSTTTSIECTQLQDSSFAIIKVHAMYDTGLNKNVNMKLHITEQTTSRDIINLIVRHLNTIVKKKGKGNYAYSEESLGNFCLVLKFPDHEQILRDDCRLLCLREHLQTAKICVTILGTIFSQDLEQATVV